jgi:hypothetical protein
MHEITSEPQCDGPRTRVDQGPVVEALTATSPKIRIWPDLGLLTTFWAYVALSNVLWGTSMQASLASIGVSHVFAPWNARLVQHLLLYPALIGGMWASRRVGWQPAWRGVPLQLLCGLTFAVLANPAMDIAEKAVGLNSWSGVLLPSLSGTGDMYPGQHSFLWLASATTFLLNYVFCLGLLAGFEFYRRYRDSQLRSEALERSLSAAHLTTLRMQLSPHTLFNLLHTIRGHVAWDPAVAQSMIVQLGDLLRRVLRTGQQDLSRLDEELDFVRLYLQLQQRRFADRLLVAIPEPGSCPSVWVPSLILQPLVENAVVHGLAHGRTQVTVQIDVLVDGESLILRVVNSLAPGHAIATSGQTGIGLNNVRERLTIQFGERGTLSAGPGPNSDWVAAIRIPVLHNGL